MCRGIFVQEKGMEMFLYPSSINNDPILAGLESKGQEKTGQHNFSTFKTKENTDGIHVLNVPFCINIMAGGKYKTKQQISMTSLSEREHFHLEKNQMAEDGILYEVEQTEKHHHDYFELMYIMEGAVEQHIEDGCFFYKKGSASLLNRNTRHFEILNENYLIVYLCFSKEYVRGLVGDANNGKNNNPVLNFFLSNLTDPAQYQKDYLEFVPNAGAENQSYISDGIIENIAQELLLRQPGHTYIVQGLLARLFATLQTPEIFIMKHRKLDSTAESYWFNKIAQYMEQKNGRVSRAELAEHLNYSSDYVNRIVKKRTGMSISEYSRMLCLKTAEKQLLETNKSISVIIHDLGFENKTHFYKLFDQKHGVTPLEYRSANRENIK